MNKGIGKHFMERTQYKYQDKSDQQKGLPQPPLVLPHETSPSAIQLPNSIEVTVSKLDLTEAIVRRRSIRRYTKQALSIEELSYLLWCSQGVKEVTSRPATLRTVPSAGSRHPFETYLLINRVEGIEPGLYRFLPVEHQIQLVNGNGNLADKIQAACLNQVMVTQSAVTFIWVAVAYRTMWRYGERGYRYMHLDAGHVCQNLYLAAEPVDCGVCAIAAFEDEKINKLVGVDGESQFVIYVATVGKKA